MRLLETRTLQLRQFLDSEIEPYAILSHMWGEPKEEVLFEDIQGGTAVRKGKGYAKVKACCDKAREDGFLWVWIDTLCIDKSSSAELSEAINSMFEWYKKSAACYAYLEDVSAHSPECLDKDKTTHVPAKKKRKIDARRRDAKGRTIFPPHEFYNSRWLTRGWTLQELIAPKSVEFFTAEWAEIGTKASLGFRLSETTRIPLRVLRGDSPLTCSVAERMSWASERQTTRDEDLAYSLLGIFDVNMPMLYGEGKKSFLRLQGEILKQEEDYTIFSWALRGGENDSVAGFLASSPGDFSWQASTEFTIPAKQSELHRHLDDLNSRPRESETSDLDSESTRKRTPRTSEERVMEDYYNSESGVTPWYEMLRVKNYQQIQRCIQNGRLSFAFGASERGRGFTEDDLRNLEPREPPGLSSRGLRVSLPVRKSPNPAAPSTAWIYCQVDCRLLCILLDSSISSRLSGRFAAPWLVTVDANLLDEFTLTDLYAFPNGTLSPGSDQPLPPSTSLTQLSCIRVETTESAGSLPCHIVSQYTPGKFEVNEFFVQEEPPMAASILFGVSHNTGATRFEVHVGFYRGLPWCQVLEEPVRPDTLAELFTKSNEFTTSTTELGGKSDRSVTVTTGLYISACVRKVQKHLTSKGEQAGYMLRVSVYPVQQLGRLTPRWIDIYLSLSRTLNRSDIT